MGIPALAALGALAALIAQAKVEVVRTGEPNTPGPDTPQPDNQVKQEPASQKKDN